MSKENGIKIAAFDVDGTLKPDVLSLFLLEELVRKGLFSGQVLQSLADLEAAYAAKQLGREEMSSQWLAQYLEGVAGHNPQDYLQTAREVWEGVKTNTFPFVAELMTELSHRGFQPVVISASPWEIVSQFCAEYGIKHFRATEVAINEEGFYTNKAKVQLSLAEHKLKELYSLAEQLYPGKEVNWARSLAMGDSFSDVEMLKVTGKPVVMKEENREPNELVQIALENKWTVVNEKDALAKILELVDEEKEPEPVLS